MNKYILLLIGFFLSASIQAQTKLDSLLQVLDQVVEQRHTYAEQKEKALEGLKNQLQAAGSLEQQFQILGKEFDEYSSYQTDSAYAVVAQRMAVAHQLDTPQVLAEAYMNLAEVYRTTGLYKETLEVLEQVSHKGWSSYDLAYYYHLHHSLYMLMADYAVLDADKKEYNRLLFDYKDSLLQVLEPQSLSYALVESSYYTMQGEFQEALDKAQAAYEEYGGDSPLINFTLAEIYHYLGDRQQEKTFLAASAIGDLKNSVKEYLSLHRLATLLYEDGDLDRAYNYMRCALEDAVFSNSRLRTLEVSKMLPYINKAYEAKMEQERDRLIISLSVTTILFFILFFTLYYIYKQVRQLSLSKEKQRQMNAMLQASNQALTAVNDRLTEADHVKEEYISYLFSMCSNYISKLEDFRLHVKRNLQTNRVKQLEKMVDTSNLVADELKEFFASFDAIFLKIYPSFVEEFNELMTDEGKITPKKGDLLTPELRIFALVRLGISDSVKIAEFLHYSPQTIYNYRLKIRNKAKCSKEEFLERISEIGALNKEL